MGTLGPAVVGVGVQLVAAVGVVDVVAVEAATAAEVPVPVVVINPPAP